MKGVDFVLCKKPTLLLYATGEKDESIQKCQRQTHNINITNVIFCIDTAATSTKIIMPY